MVWPKTTKPTTGEPQQVFDQQGEMSKSEDDILYGLGEAVVKAKNLRFLPLLSYLIKFSLIY